MRQFITVGLNGVTLGALYFLVASAHETARVIWGPDPSGRLPTGFMLSIDLPEAALSDLPQ